MLAEQKWSQVTKQDQYFGGVERGEVLRVLREKAAAVLGADDLEELAPLAQIDSLALVELVMDLEDALGIELTEPEVASASTVGALVDLAVAKTS